MSAEGRAAVCMAMCVLAGTEQSGLQGKEGLPKRNPALSDEDTQDAWGCQVER